MTDDASHPPGRGRRPAAPDPREARLAEALRANLRRRKDRARAARRDAEPPADGDAPDPAPDDER